jgi:hypothetical protein
MLPCGRLAKPKDALEQGLSTVARTGRCGEVSGYVWAGRPGRVTSSWPAQLRVHEAKHVERPGRGLADKRSDAGGRTGRATMAVMAVAAKKLDIKIGDLVEIEGRQYDVVSDKQGGIALEPAITKTVAEILAEESLTPMSKEEFEEQFGHLPSDGEG